jgi:hypothetical protein
MLKLGLVGLFEENAIVMDFEKTQRIGKKTTKPVGELLALKCSSIDVAQVVRSITSLLYLPMQAQHVVSSGSTNG